MSKLSPLFAAVAALSTGAALAQGQRQQDPIKVGSPVRVRGDAQARCEEAKAEWTPAMQALLGRIVVVRSVKEQVVEVGQRFLTSTVSFPASALQTITAGRRSRSSVSGRLLAVGDKDSKSYGVWKVQRGPGVFCFLAGDVAVEILENGNGWFRLQEGGKQYVVIDPGRRWEQRLIVDVSGLGKSKPSGDLAETDEQGGAYTAEFGEDKLALVNLLDGSVLEIEKKKPTGQYTVGGKTLTFGR